MSTRKPRRLPLPRSRALVSDLLSFAQAVPTCAHERIFHLDVPNTLRQKTSPRIAWPAIFIRAYSLVAVKHPVLRQCHLKWPWPHLYEHPHQVATLAIAREHLDDKWLFFGNFDQPEEKSLVELQQQLNSFKFAPVEKVFAHQIRASNLPRLLRWFLLWGRYNLLGRKRAKRFGTFGLTTVSSRGALIPDPPGLLTSTLSYGPVDEQGRCRVSISYDHRLMDGWFVAELLAQIERIINSKVAQELNSLQHSHSTPLRDAA